MCSKLTEGLSTIIKESYIYHLFMQNIVIWFNDDLLPIEEIQERMNNLEKQYEEKYKDINVRFIMTSAYMTFLYSDLGNTHDCK